MGLGSSRNEEVPETVVPKYACEIKHLPNELLECILLKLSYDEIAQVRRVCRRFRDVADGILDREFQCLKARTETRLAALVQEENAPSGTGSTGGEESDSAPRTLPPQISSRELLDAICSEIRLMRAVCYRPLFLSEVPQVILLSSSYFKGKIIDVVHRILRLLRSRWVETEIVRWDVHRFVSLVDHRMLLFFREIEPTSISAKNKSKYPDLFGSKVIDLLESIRECKKDITVNIDSGGWCYMKGEYKLHTRYWSILPFCYPRRTQLTVTMQRQLQNSLFFFARSRCLSHFDELEHSIVHRDRLALWTFDNLRWPMDQHLIFKVDLKCRRELAPVELLVELLKAQSYESAPGAHTAQDPSPDLELKLQILWVKGKWDSDSTVCELLIQQRH
jgi:hypothetical protein